MTWWKDYFSSDDLPMLEALPDPAAVDALADFACRRLNLHAGSRVLDVGCGYGKHAAALAKRGCAVTAIDGSPDMVDHAQQHAAREHAFVIELKDFHALDHHDCFDAVVCLGNTLGYGTRDDDRLAVQCMANALIPGGRLLIEHHHRPWYIEHALGRTWWEEPDAFVLSEIELDERRDRLLTRDIILPKDGGPPRTWTMSLLQYTPEGLRDLLNQAGIASVNMVGTDGNEPPVYGLPLDHRSPVMLAVGQKSS